MHRSADRSLLYPSVARSVVGGLIAIAVILASIVGINVLTRDKKKSAGAPSTSTSARSPAASSSTRSGTSSGGTQTSTTSAKPAAPAAKPPAKPTAAATPSASATASPSQAPAPSAPPVALPRIALTVFNNSRIRDLAKAAAGDFRAAGWSVADDNIGNTTYRPRVTTVYYLPGQETLARQLMRDVPGVQRMLLRPRSLPGHGLTVVVTREYAAG